MLPLYPRHILDITTRDLIKAAGGGFNDASADYNTRALESSIGPESIVTLSVRSAWDLILTAYDFPPGSEVIMSSVTIPDMMRIAEAHGLKVVPVDLDPRTMMPCIKTFSRAFTPSTRITLIAHLLGGSFDIKPYAVIAELHGIPLIEDRAQAFRGPHYWGSSDATASLFSFGSIKTCTALGGAVSIVRDPVLLDCMHSIQAELPVQSSRVFERKARKYLGVQGFRSRFLYGAVAGVASRGKGGLDGFISSTVKGFRAADTEQLLRQLRQQPSGAQVSLLRRRLDRFDQRRLSDRQERGELLQAELSLVCDVLGAHQPDRTHWLLAVLVDDPRTLITRLRANGFDATQAASTIGAISASERVEFEPTSIRNAMSKAVFLPAYPEMRSRDAAKLINTIFLHAILKTPLDCGRHDRARDSGESDKKRMDWPDGIGLSMLSAFGRLHGPAPGGPAAHG